MIRTLIICLVLASSARAETLLVLCDKHTWTNHQTALTTWSNLVVGEGRFTFVGWDLVDRVDTTNDAVRYQSVTNIQRRILTLAPEAVQIWGHVPHPMSGHGIPDGHIEGDGAFATDLWYADPDRAQTDVQDYVSGAIQPWMNNVPGDLRWDLSYGSIAGLNCIVSRVSFAEAPGIDTSSMTNDCYVGDPVPPLDEHASMTNYLARDIAYRTGSLVISNGVTWMQSIRDTDTKNAYKNQLTNHVDFWRDVNSELPTNGVNINSKFVFNGNMPDAVYTWLDANNNCEPYPVLWMVNFRSYAWEWLGIRQGIKRFGLIALMYIWVSDGGDGDSTVEVEDAEMRFFTGTNTNSTHTIDDIENLLRSQTVTGPWAGNSPFGDLTLPYTQPPPRRVTTDVLNINTLNVEQISFGE